MSPNVSIGKRTVPRVALVLIRNGHLFLALMTDGGIYEFEPIKKTR
jgi:hypothetical protein